MVKCFFSTPEVLGLISKTFPGEVRERTTAFQSSYGVQEQNDGRTHPQALLGEDGLLDCVRGDDFSTGTQGMLWSRTRVSSLYFLSSFLLQLLCGPFRAH